MILLQIWVKTGIHEALRHIFSVLTETTHINFDYAYFLKHYYERVQSQTIMSKKFCPKILTKHFKKV